MRGKDCPTGRAKFVNTKISRNNKNTCTKYICYLMNFGVTISICSSDSIFVRYGFVDNGLLIQRAAGLDPWMNSDADLLMMC